jgi:hypothetical protein
MYDANPLSVIVMTSRVMSSMPCAITSAAVRCKSFEVDGDQDDIIELQNSRTIAMGVGNYCVPIDIVKHLSVRSIDAFRALSTTWHRFLGVDDHADEDAREYVGASDVAKRESCSGRRSAGRGSTQGAAASAGQAGRGLQNCGTCAVDGILAHIRQSRGINVCFVKLRTISRPDSDQVG